MKELTIGQFIDKLRSLKNQKGYISFTFGNAYPTNIDSYRGYYDELCLEFSSEYHESIFVYQLLEKCEECIGKEFTGWKGGEYTMDENTPLWVAGSGCTSNTKIYDVIAKYKDDEDGMYEIKTFEVDDE